MTEKQLESAFVRWANSLNIRALRSSCEYEGFPDRFVHLPNGGGTVYVEFKELQVRAVSDPEMVEGLSARIESAPLLCGRHT